MADSIDDRLTSRQILRQPEPTPGISPSARSTAALNRSTAACFFCRQDKKKCIWVDGQDRCARCEKLQYDCSMSEPPAGSTPRRLLNRYKCTYCRNSHMKCLPADRVWPNKCDRCVSQGLPCSAPQTSATQAAKNSERSESNYQPISLEEARSDHSIQIESSGANLPWTRALQLVRNRPVDESASWAVGNRQIDDLADRGTPALSMSHRRRLESSVERERIVPLRSPNKRFRETRIHQTSIDTNLPSSGFRVLKVRAAERNAPIVCDLVPWQGGTKFEFISYAWEYPLTDAHTIIVNGHPRTVQPNVFALLHDLQYGIEERNLWIDALCIDMENLEDRNAQIALIPHILRKAENLIIWLGADDDQTEPAFTLMASARDVDRFRGSLIHREDYLMWKAFLFLFKHRYFWRRWCVQEIALSTKIVMKCGPRVETWSNFVDCCRLAEYLQSVTEVESDVIQGTAGVEIINAVSSMENNRWTDLFAPLAPALRFVHFLDNLFRKDTYGKPVVPVLNLEQLVYWATPLETSLAHDRIYSLLALAKDAAKRPREITASSIRFLVYPSVLRCHKPSWNALAKAELLVSTTKRAISNFLRLRRKQRLWFANYGQPVAYLYRDFVDHCIEMSGSLDIICRPWAPQIGGLPSWIATTEQASQKREPRKGQFSRNNADELVSAPGFPSIYSASAGRLAEHKIFEGELGTLTLRVTGITAGRILWTGIPALAGNIHDSWLKICDWNDRSSQPPGTLWRTLVADRDSKGNNPPYYYQQFCFDLFSDNSTNTINLDERLAELRSKPKRDYLQRVQEVVWNRTLIRVLTEDPVRYGPDALAVGLAPMHTQVGDEIAVLDGCSVPVVLRPQSNSERNAKQLIGQCYVHGIMDGQAEAIRDHRGAEEFFLV